MNNSIRKSNNNIKLPRNVNTPRFSQIKRLPSKIHTEANFKLWSQMDEQTDNLLDNISEMMNNLMRLDEKIQHYHGDDLILNKKKVRKMIHSENEFYQDQSIPEKTTKYLYYPNVGLSNSQSLMRSMTTYLRSTDKIYNVPERSKQNKKLFLKDIKNEIMFNLETKHKDKSLNFNDPKLMSMIQIKTEEEKHRFSSWKKKREEKLVEQGLQNISLIHDLRRKMMTELKKPFSSEMSSEEKKEILNNIRNKFIPEQKKKIIDQKIFEQKIKKNAEMTSKKSINNAYYQLIALDSKSRSKIKKEIEQTMSGLSRFASI